MAAASDLAVTGRRGSGVGSDGLTRDVVAGLRRRPKQIPARYLYDALGSQLFEAICELPWYPITRGERALLGRERDAILERLLRAGELPTLDAVEALLQLSETPPPEDVHIDEVELSAYDHLLDGKEEVAPC